MPCQPWTDLFLAGDSESFFIFNCPMTASCVGRLRFCFCFCFYHALWRKVGKALEGQKTPVVSQLFQPPALSRVSDYRIPPCLVTSWTRRVVFFRKTKLVFMSRISWSIETFFLMDQWSKCSHTSFVMSVSLPSWNNDQTDSTRQLSLTPSLRLPPVAV